MATHLSIETQQPNSVRHLTEALKELLQELPIKAPKDISIFFEGSEVYRYHSQDGSTFWWNDVLTDASDPNRSNDVEGI
ncbi:MAG: hypothetical protein SFW36_06765 [Leptolyngbyaceae cyanobacterium bins.59]|nr:hypothetical protein [Leptolyngbyaceae cyanobacterium bins.59]